MSLPVLSLMIFLPLASALVLILMPRDRPRLFWASALTVSLIVLALSIAVFAGFDSGTENPQFVERMDWLGNGIEYHVGVDGISLLLILLTAFLVPVAVAASRNSVRDRVKEYVIFLLVLEAGMIGVFAALNLFLFYIFWEAVLIPMYFLIGIWGGSRRVYATLKFVLVTMFGSLLMLVAIIALHILYLKAAGTHSFAIFDLYRLALSPQLQAWLFLAFALAFAIKVPLFPFHTWLPDAHVEAPTAISVLLAAVLLKMGGYGFLRLALPLFPDAAARFLPVLIALSLIGIVYGGLMALVQKDIKSLVAYSSVSHMGLIMLAVVALNPEAGQGALLQMVNHGLSTGALFLCVGVLYERAHTRLIKDFGGVSRQMPVFSAFFLISVLSSLGLPGLNGFVGELLCLFGVFKLDPWLAIPAVTTVILSAAYLLGMFRGVMQGPLTNEKISRFHDLTPGEAAYLLPMIALMFWIGIYPAGFLNKTEASVKALLAQAKGKRMMLVKRPADSVRILESGIIWPELMSGDRREHNLRLAAGNRLLGNPRGGAPLLAGRGCLPLSRNGGRERSERWKEEARSVFPIRVDFPLPPEVRRPASFRFNWRPFNQAPVPPGMVRSWQGFNAVKTEGVSRNE